jgi:hypothetical protein
LRNLKAHNEYDLIKIISIENEEYLVEFEALFYFAVSCHKVVGIGAWKKHPRARTPAAVGAVMTQVVSKLVPSSVN